MVFQLTSTLVEKTIEILDNNGWCQHTYTDPGGAHCSIGAFRKARDEAGLFYQSSLDVALAERMGFEGVNGLMTWNDDVATTKEQVIDLFTDVAKSLRDEGR